MCTANKTNDEKYFIVHTLLHERKLHKKCLIHKIGIKK
jgi:hypothetical protein